jgi:transcriptional regulator with XRE-family HTH domain
MTFFALKFKEIRKYENLTQQKFADKLEVSRNSIAQIEMGKNTPTTDLIIKILDVFLLSPNYLFDYKEKVNISKSKEYIEIENLEAQFDIRKFINEHKELESLYASFCSIYLIAIDIGSDLSIINSTLKNVLQYEYLTMNSSKLYSLAKNQGWEKQLIETIIGAKSYFIGYINIGIFSLHNETFIDEDSFFDAKDNFKKYIEKYNLKK